MNLKEVLDELEVDYKEPGTHHHVTDNFYGVDCPYCSPDSGRFRMGLNFVYNYATCWVCGSKPLYEVLAGMTRKSSQLGLLLKGLSRGKIKTSKPIGKLIIPYGVEPLGPAHRRYLKSRRFDPDALERDWGIKGIGIAPELSWRIWIPITAKGETVSWTTRAIADGPDIRRYINAKESQEKFPAKHTLLGIDRCQNTILVVEGAMDVYRLGYGAAATMGIKYTREQLWKIARFPRRVICFDMEPREAQLAADRLCEDLACFEGVTYRVELGSKDPDGASELEIQKLREHFLQ